ncbi:MAG: methylaspartate ammonia-lyase [Bacillota bacterium]|jgi:methylaspartate ammonia-lyase
MKIVGLTCARGLTGFFFDDQRAIKKGAVADGAVYRGCPITPGFQSVRQPGEAISVLLLLEDGQVAYGDCAAVQYSGAGGRDPLFLSAEFIPFIEREIKPLLVGRELSSFRETAKEIDNLEDEKGQRIHTALRYGITQAVLDGVAKSRKMLMAEVVADEYQTEVSDKEIPIFVQSGDERYSNADKMMLKRAPVLPHGLINNVPTKLGERGEKLLEYLSWLVKRIRMLVPDQEYQPVLHIDVYGTLGLAFNNNWEKIICYFRELEKISHPFKLRIEGPVDMEDRERQVTALRELTELVNENGIQVEIVADEWCNTLADIKYFADHRAGHMVQIKTPDLGGIHNVVEATLYCKEKGIGTYQGGTCNETDRSAQVCVHLAMAAQPDQMLAKPGMGVDEGLMIVYNEMQRILALRKGKK